MIEVRGRGRYLNFRNVIVNALGWGGSVTGLLTVSNQRQHNLDCA